MKTKRLRINVVVAGGLAVVAAVLAGAGCMGPKKKSVSRGVTEQVDARASLEELEASIKDAGANMFLVPKPVLKRLIAETKRVQARNEALMNQLKSIKNIDLEERERLYTAD